MDDRDLENIRSTLLDLHLAIGSMASALAPLGNDEAVLKLLDRARLTIDQIGASESGWDQFPMARLPKEG